MGSLGTHWNKILQATMAKKTCNYFFSPLQQMYYARFALTVSKITNFQEKGPLSSSNTCLWSETNII